MSAPVYILYSPAFTCDSRLHLSRRIRTRRTFRDSSPWPRNRVGSSNAAFSCDDYRVFLLRRGTSKRAVTGRGASTARSIGIKLIGTNPARRSGSEIPRSRDEKGVGLGKAASYIFIYFTSRLPRDEFCRAAVR